MEDFEKYTTIPMNIPVMLSKTVSLRDATESKTAIRLGLDNTPPPEIMDNLIRTAELVDKIRTQFPIAQINSFYRSPSLNRKLKGAKNSQHVTGEAVDIDSPDDNYNLWIFAFVKDQMVFDQLILEYPTADGTPSWVHVSIRHKDNRGQVLVKLAKGYIPYGTYQVGMV